MDHRLLSAIDHSSFYNRRVLPLVGDANVLRSCNVLALCVAVGGFALSIYSELRFTPEITTTYITKTPDPNSTCQSLAAFTGTPPTPEFNCTDWGPVDGGGIAGQDLARCRGKNAALVLQGGAVNGSCGTYE